MGGTSDSEGASALLWRELLNLDEEDGSLACILDQQSTRAARTKRTRSRNWIPVERKKYLEAMLEAVRGTAKGSELWGFISRRLGEGSGVKFSRSPKECEYFWGTLRKAFRAIERHEKRLGGRPKGSVQFPRTVCYFEMDEQSRSRNKFLPLPCYELMHTILVDQEKQKEKRQQSADHGELSHMVHSVVDGDHVTQLSPHHKSLESLVAEQSESAVNNFFQSLRCRFSKVDSHELSRLLAPVRKQRVIDAVIAPAILNVEILASKGFCFDVDDLKLASFVENFIKVALESAMLPVSSELEALEEIQKKHPGNY